MANLDQQTVRFIFQKAVSSEMPPMGVFCPGIRPGGTVAFHNSHDDAVRAQFQPGETPLGEEFIDIERSPPEQETTVVAEANSGFFTFNIVENHEPHNPMALSVLGVQEDGVDNACMHFDGFEINAAATADVGTPVALTVDVLVGSTDNIDVTLTYAENDTPIQPTEVIHGTDTIVVHFMPEQTGVVRVEVKLSEGGPDDHRQSGGSGRGDIIIR